MKHILILLLALCLLPCALAEEAPDCDLYVPQIDLPEDFIIGMDVSSVIALENAGVTYKDFDGNERDLFAILKENGVNTIRVRVWNDPFDAEGRGYGGGNNDVDTAIAIGKRATEHGMQLMVDFHYSDFWADPGKQQAPKAWKGLRGQSKIDALYAFTFDALTRMKDAGVNVGLVQIGNETNGKFCGESRWGSACKLFNAGSKAVRDTYPDALVVMHFANPEKPDNYRKWAKSLQDNGVDYDVFASSYYPYWHGTLDNLTDILTEIRTTYGKQVMVAETSYAWTAEDGDFHGNIIGEGSAVTQNYPYTVQGQVNAIADVIRAVNAAQGIGVCYWESAWVPVPGGSWEANAALWEQHGAGWAASFAGEYDSADAGRYYGGSAVDNQAMFDFDGKALESLKMFHLLATGNDVPLKADAIDPVTLMIDLNGEVVLPETVSAIMNDNTRRDVPVTWDAYDAAAMKSGGVKTYLIPGVADGLPATCEVAMVEYNYVADWSFEEQNGSAVWRASNLANTDQLYVEEKKTDSLTGTRHYHFYSEKAGLAFELEQDVTALAAGSYKYSIALMGGDAGETDIYAYVKINGETVATAPGQITNWNEWHTILIENVEVREGDTVTVGLHVACANAGAWGKIDDVKLNRMGN